jgi:inhibitor of cysteine peptidase
MRLLVLLVCLLGACMSANAVVLTEQDKNKTVSVAVGEAFTVRLSENPTTGYVWAVEGMAEVLALQSTDYVTDAVPNGEMMVGIGGKKSFVFVAKKVGAVTLKFKEWRPWEGDTSIVNKFDVHTKVKK